MTNSAAADAAAACQDELLRAFRTYDRAADIVAIFEYIFSHTDDLSHQIAHFERFPYVGPTRLTPDFTALTTTNRGIVGEIARMAVHDRSVDRLCDQLGKYAVMDALPGPNGRSVEVSSVDVILFVDMDIGLAALRRIIYDRLLSDEHVYTAPVAPVIIQVSQDAQTSKYNFQRLPDSENGVIRDDDWPIERRLSRRLAHETLSVPPKYFVDIKADRPLVNDPVPAIYLAVLLWSQVLPELALANPDEPELRISSGELASLMRARWGRGRTADVDEALALLREAGLASRPGGGAQWRIKYRKIRVRGGELQDEIIRRVCASRSTKVLVRQLTLLDEQP